MTDLKPAAGVSRYPNIVAFVRDTPWQILEQTLRDITDLVSYRASGHEFTEEEITERIGQDPARRDMQMVGNVAVIPIHGVITPRADAMRQMSGGTSIDRLQASIQDAADNPDVAAIVLDVNSPGGSVAGLAEAAQTIRAARQKKPVVAVANHTAGSAAYRLASQASELVVTPSGHVGSVGTLAAHEDISQLEEKAGIKTTVVHAGKYKAELSPFAPLSAEAKAYLQETVDKHQQMFEQDVARGRGIPVDQVRSDFGQGRMLLARDAVKAGMADRVGTLQDVVSGLQKQAAAGHQARQTFEPTAPTTDAPWDGPRMKANLPNGPDNEQTYLKAFAWFDDKAADPNGDGYPDNKGDYKFIHHMVSDQGEVGAANVTACSQGIAVLNGGRTGTTIPEADRQGVWEHLARHLRDAGEPPPLKSLAELSEAATSGLSYAERANALLVEASLLVDDISSLAEVRSGRLTKAKREPLSACSVAFREVADTLDRVLAATDKETAATPSADLLRERLRFERNRANII